MAKGNYIKGITVVIGGDTSDLQKSLKDVDAQIKSTENELKTVERLLKIDPKNTDLLAKKQQLLNSEIETTKNKLNSLKQAKEKADKTMKDGNADQLKAYTQLREEIQKTEQKLKNLEQASSKFTQTGEKLQSVGNKMTDVGQKGMVLTGAITALGVGVAASAESTREYREDMSRLEAAFVSAGKTTEAAKQIYDDFYVILGESDRSVEAVNHLAKLCNSEQELADWSTICAGVSATFGDSLPIEGLTEAANETAKVSKVTGPLADALNWAGVSEDDFNTKLEQCNSEQERSKLITSTLTELYKEAAAQFKENNADVIANREATQMWNDELAKLGATVEPVLTALREKVAELLSWFNNLTDGQKKTLAATLALTAAIPPLLVGMGNVITSIGTVTKSLSSCKGQVTKLFALISAHPLGALLTAVTALTVGLGAYAYANDETAQKVRELTNESKNLIKESDELINSANQTEASLAAQKDTVNGLIDRLYELEGQDGKTTEAKNEMHSIVNQLNSLIPNLNLSINEETGLLNMQSGTVKQLANDYINLAYAKAYANKITEASEKIIGLQTSNKSLSETRDTKALIMACYPKKEQTAVFFDGIRKYKAAVYADKLPEFGKRSFSAYWNIPFVVSLTLPKFYWTDFEATNIPIFSRKDEFETSFTLPCAFTSRTSCAEIDNTSGFDFYPVIRITAEENVTNGKMKIVNETTGEYIGLDGFSLEKGKIIVIDCENYTATLDGENIINSLNDFENFKIIPGENSVKCVCNDELTTLNATIEYYKKWIGV